MPEKFIPDFKPYVGPDVYDAVHRVLERGKETRNFTVGEETKAFEEEFAKYIGSKYAISLHSGTAALQAALRAIGIKPGDEIITTAHTFIATLEVVWLEGARVVLADIEPNYYNIDPEDIKKKITDKTKAIIPVHIYGHPADMDPIMEIAEEHNLYVIEDACQAHGAKYKGKNVGTIGHAAAFSFQTSKNMTVLGDGGMLVTNDPEIAEYVLMFRDHGRKRIGEYLSEIVGHNFRLDEMKAAIGRVALKHLDEWNKKRREIAKVYDEELSGLKYVEPPKVAEWAYHVYYRYVVKITGDRNKEQFLKFMRDAGIGAISYRSCHTQPVFKKVEGYVPKLPVTEELVDVRLADIPMHPELTDEEVSYIVEKVKEFSEKYTP
ncbi:MAG: DegT/DnrJ/EryC1/StrS family aminotransferase [Candidatus Odinarchaeota archaeon]|nr:DegT/DnrJ/EryC1/StrS family aminotransferase [Candidatus Odinarchaeota archaeon]